MKNILPTFLILFIFFSCNNKEEEKSPEEKAGQICECFTKAKENNDMSAHKECEKMENALRDRVGENSKTWKRLSKTTEACD